MPRTQPGRQGDLPEQIAPRHATVEKLAALVDEWTVVHVRGTPSSGKTTLANLLQLHYQQRGQRIVFITGWPEDVNWKDHLIMHCQAAGIVEINTGNFWKTNVIFLLDEGQISYHDAVFWLEFVKTLSGKWNVTGPKLCVFASYGSPENGPLDYPRGATPLHLAPPRRVSVIKPSGRDSHDVCLYFDEADFNDAVDRLCSESDGVVIDEKARSLLYSTTNGHPGAVTALVQCLYLVCGTVACS